MDEAEELKAWFKELQKTKFSKPKFTDIFLISIVAKAYSFLSKNEGSNQNTQKNHPEINKRE